MHRSLADASAPCPFDLWLASRCAAFPGRFVTEILAEEQRLPVGYLDEVLEIQAYVQAYLQTEAADTAEARKRLPKTRLFALVTELDLALAAEERQNKG